MLTRDIFVIQDGLVPVRLAAAEPPRYFRSDMTLKKIKTWDPRQVWATPYGIAPPNFMKPNSDKRSTKIDLDGVLVSNPPINESFPSVSSPPRSDGKGKEAAPSSGRLTKRGASPSFTDPGRKVLRGPPRTLTLTKVDEAGEAAGSDPVNEAPWETFKKFYYCDLAGKVTVCTRQSGCRGPWTIPQNPRKDADRMLRVLRCIRHTKVASVFECFQTSDNLYTIGMFLPLTISLHAKPSQTTNSWLQTSIWTSATVGSRICGLQFILPFSCRQI